MTSSGLHQTKWPEANEKLINDNKSIIGGIVGGIVAPDVFE